MKLNRRRLRKIINETRQDHILGIRNKLINLKKERDRLLAIEKEFADSAKRVQDMFPDDPYAGYDDMDMAWPTMQLRFAVDDKINFLTAQLEALGDDGGGPVIDLPRG